MLMVKLYNLQQSYKNVPILLFAVNNKRKVAYTKQFK